jgi:hypothetical protein
MIRATLLMGTALILAGCGEKVSAVSQNEPFHIASVQALGPPPKDSSDAQLRDLRDQTIALGARVPQSKNPYLLRLRIVNFHQKNAALSLLVGDTNNITVSGEVWSLDGTTLKGRFTSTAQTDIAINGLIGAAIAAGTSTNDIVRRLDNEAANGILEQVYGTKAWNSWGAHR